MVDGKQDSVRIIPKFYNGSAQLFQLKQPPHHREEAGTGVASLSTPQSQELLIDPYPRCLSLHTALNLRESIVARLAGENNSRHPEVGIEDGIEDSDEEGLQDGDMIAPSSKAVLLVSYTEKSNLKAIQLTEDVLIDVDGGSKEQDLLNDNELILHHPYHMD